VGKRYLEEFGCKTPVFVVPHPPVESEAAIRRAEAAATGYRSQMPRDAVVIGVFGDLNAAKGIEALLEAAGTIETPVHVQLGARAREHMRELARSEATARGYERAILETLGLLQDPARQALARWAGALLDCGVSEEEMHEGFGLSYIQALSTFARSVG